jgi:BirA family biotin operon repressor/biotin-[acetyl-CoA-carboxylase] ligase
MIHNTLFTGKLLIHQAEMQSTNDFAKDIISKTTPIDGTVILADAQTKGKGQGSNQWLTQPNENLTFSIVFNTHFLPANQQFYMNMAIANGVRQALQVLDKSNDYFIKWPNDIIGNHFKIGGILIENTIMGAHLKYSIIGVGVNVNQTIFENLPNATSIKQLTHQNYVLPEVLNTLCAQIENQFLRLRNGKLEAIREDYNEHLFQLEKQIDFVINRQTVHGKIKEVNALGQMGIEVAHHLHYYNHGEIKWVLDARQ